MTTVDVKDELYATVAAMRPHDALEVAHRADTLEWIQSTAGLFRVQKPDVPAKHLVSYFVLYDKPAGAVLLVDHIKAGLWVPPGGHVEPGEAPKETVRRECLEELQADAEFLTEEPLFVTVTQTVNTARPHTDVSLWYVLRGTAGDSYIWDREEFRAVRWWPLAEIKAASDTLFDPQLKRFIQKLEAAV